jgi:endo-1,4-beta-xylanase
MKYFPVLIMVVMMTGAGCKRNPERLIDCKESSLFERADFYVGVAVSLSRLNNHQVYREKVLSQFNSVTAEYAFKPSFIQPSKNNFNWEEADRLTDLALKYNKNIHGHTLIWHEEIPDWMWAYQGDWRDLMKDHIYKVITRYRGRIKAWDVVNEAFDENGNLRDSPWREKIGDDYIGLAFRYAREADPDAMLFYNENYLETNPRKQQAVINMIRDFKSAGVPIDGVGLQFHISYNYPTDRQVKQALKMFSELGVKIHISELDVALNLNGNEKKPTYRLLKEQKKKIEVIVKEYKALPAEIKYAITLWGVSDEHSWIRDYFEWEDWPLLYDDDYKIKPCYCGFIDGLR